jgi:hypothetical protein
MRPAREDGKPTQQRLLLLAEQVEAPVDGRAQRLLPRRRGPVAMVSSLNLSATRMRICSTASTRTRAAASSIASGMPSRSRQIAVT